MPDDLETELIRMRERLDALSGPGVERVSPEQIGLAAWGPPLAAAWVAEPTFLQDDREGMLHATLALPAGVESLRLQVSAREVRVHAAPRGEASFALPREVDPASVTATLRNGVLDVSLRRRS